MANDVIFFWTDQLHSSQSTPILTASSTQLGYASEFAREADLFRAWKPVDSASTDEWLKADGGSLGWMGAVGTTAYVAVSYDARGSNQSMLTLQTHSLDDGTFTGGTLTTVASHTMATDKIACWYTTFVLPNPTKRYYRLIQKGTDRIGGSVTAKIFDWAMFRSSDVLSFVRDFPGHSESGYPLNSLFRVSQMQGSGGLVIANKFAAPGYDFTISIKPASDAVFKTIRDQFDAIGGWQRAIYVSKTGIPNSTLGTQDFFLCRLSQDWSSSRRYLNQSEMLIPMRTEPWL